MLVERIFANNSPIIPRKIKVDQCLIIIVQKSLQAILKFVSNVSQRDIESAEKSRQSFQETNLILVSFSETYVKKSRQKPQSFLRI